MIVMGCLDLGGAERLGVQLGHGLAARHGATAEVWGFRPPGRAAQLCDELGVPWRFVSEPWGPGSLRWPGMIWNFSRMLRRHRVDVLLPVTSFPNILCGLCWRFGRAGTCIWNQQDEGMNLESRLARLAARNTPRFLSNTRTGAALLVERFGVDARRIRMVRNIVRVMPAAEGRESWRARLQISPETLLAVMVANVHPPKDHATLLDAWRRIVSEAGAPAPVLALAGSVEPDDPIHQQIAQLGLVPHVRLLGHVADIWGLLRAADLSVFSSLSEGAPNVVLEAMAVGLPVVATDLPGIRLETPTEQADWLAPIRDAEVFARKVLALCRDPLLRGRLGELGRRHVLAENDPNRVVDDWAEALALPGRGPWPGA